MSTSRQLVRKPDYSLEDFLNLLLGAEELTGVLVIRGFFGGLKSVLCVINYIDGLYRLWYFDCVTKQTKCVHLERIEAFGVLCDVPNSEQCENDDQSFSCN